MDSPHWSPEYPQNPCAPYSRRFGLDTFKDWQRHDSAGLDTSAVRGLQRRLSEISDNDASCERDGFQVSWERMRDGL
jgi:hypothetical protein